MGSAEDHVRANLFPTQSLSYHDRLASYFAQTFVGDGSPEGVVAAPVGAVYRRRDGTPGATLYVKGSGAGNTGWLAVTVGIGETKHGREATGTVGSLLTVEVTHTWTDPFADANYSVVAQVEEGSDVGATTLRVRRIRTKTATQVSAIVHNEDVLDRSGTVHFIGMHD